MVARTVDRLLLSVGVARQIDYTLIQWILYFAREITVLQSYGVTWRLPDGVRQ